MWVCDQTALDQQQHALRCADPRVDIERLEYIA